VRSHHKLAARAIVETLYDAVRQFSKNTPQLDDVTAIVVKVKAGA
jgi:serine phosphatase RsbU (regulator of sigma subunit)